MNADLKLKTPLTWGEQTTILQNRFAVDVTPNLFLVFKHFLEVFLLALFRHIFPGYRVHFHSHLWLHMLHTRWVTTLVIFQAMYLFLFTYVLMSQSCNITLWGGDNQQCALSWWVALLKSGANLLFVFTVFTNTYYLFTYSNDDDDNNISLNSAVSKGTCDM
jgi:hypothetical protein